MKFKIKKNNQYTLNFTVGQEVTIINQKRDSALVEGEFGARAWLPLHALESVDALDTLPQEEHFYQVRFLHRDNGNFLESTWKDEDSASKRCESLNILNKSELIRYQVEKIKFDNFV